MFYNNFKAHTLIFTQLLLEPCRGQVVVSLELVCRMYFRTSRVCCKTVCRHFLGGGGGTVESRGISQDS